MPRFVAFLRGVSPVNAKMPELKGCFESAGFGDVKTVLSSGNVVFSVPHATHVDDLQKQAEAAMQARLGQVFAAFLRPVSHLRELLESDPFAEVEWHAASKRVVTFLRHERKPISALPIQANGVHIWRTLGLEVLTVYEPHPKGPVFMGMLEREFGKDITTRTWETVKKCAAA